MSKNAQDILYYDGQCPLCSFEMEHLDRFRSDELALVDVHGLDDTDTGLPSKESMLGMLHLKTRDGEWLTGVDASVRAWRSTGFGRVLEILRWPLVAPVVDAVYVRWARRRYRKLYGRDCPAEQQV